MQDQLPSHQFNQFRKFGGVLSGKHVNAPGAAGLASARGVESPGSGSATPPQFIFPKLGSRRASEHHPIGSDRSGSVLSEGEVAEL